MRGRAEGLCASGPINTDRKGRREASLRLISLINLRLEPRHSSPAAGLSTGMYTRRSAGCWYGGIPRVVGREGGYPGVYTLPWWVGSIAGYTSPTLCTCRVHLSHPGYMPGNTCHTRGYMPGNTCHTRGYMPGYLSPL